MSEGTEQLDANQVLIVEDNQTMARLTLAWLPEGLNGTIIDHRQFQTVEELAKTMRQSPALSAILDGELPGGKTAVDLIRLLKTQERPWAIVVLSANDEVVEAVRTNYPTIPAFVKAGGSDYPTIMNRLKEEITLAVQRTTY